MIRYYKLFDMLNRRKMKKTDLREILSTKTIAKLSKGEYLSGEVIEKICLFLNCQPGDIMEVVESEELENNIIITQKTISEPKYNGEAVTETYLETKPKGLTIQEADITNSTNRQLIERDDEN